MSWGSIAVGRAVPPAARTLQPSPAEDHGTARASVSPGMELGAEQAEHPLEPHEMVSQRNTGFVLGNEPFTVSPCYGKM